MTRARFIIILSILLLLSGCGAKADTPSEPEGTPLEIAAEILASQTDLPPLEFLTPDSEAFAPYLTQIYGIEEEGFLDGAIGYAGGTEASEIAVLVFSDEAAAQAARAALLDYRTFRADSFTGYVPDQAALAENGTAVCEGRYAALLLCAGPSEAQEAFRACFEPGWEPTAQPVDLASTDLPQAAVADAAEIPGESTETGSTPAVEPDESKQEPSADTPDPSGEETEGNASEVSGADAPASETPEPVPSDAAPSESESSETAGTTSTSASPSDASQDAPDNYDHDAVLSAWQSGHPSDLSEKNRAVYDAAQAIISQVITDGMTPYQKELAIHDYLTAHAHYDQEATSNAPDASPDPDNDNPYGLLVNGVGICHGYVSAFQLLMDMLDIECISVSGRGTNREHGWNMVRLDNEWYCVDVTWDDPSGGNPLHRYFNVTSQVMRQTNHEWNSKSIPEATSTRWRYQG